MSDVSETFYAGKRVLVTGHTGFVGSHLITRLYRLGARASGYSLPNDDVRDAQTLALLVRSIQPEIVFHLAAQAFVPRGFEEPRLTFETNTQGTVNLLEAIRLGELERCGVVIVTTDKVYGRAPTHHKETSPLEAPCPYSGSKVAAEYAVAAYREGFYPVGLRVPHIHIATARAGNIIGPGDQGEGRLVPNAVKALRAGKPVPVYNPDARRPWQYVEDVVDGYLLLGQGLWTSNRYEGAWNFGPNESRRVLSVVERIIKAWGSGTWELVDLPHPHETFFLSIDSTKARRELNWEPKVGFDEMIERTIKWYRG